MKLLIDLPLADGRTVVSADTDFGALLAATAATAPSVIFLRELVDLHPQELAQLLITCIEQLEAQLAAGAMVALTRTGARFRRLALLEREARRALVPIRQAFTLPTGPRLPAHLGHGALAANAAAGARGTRLPI